MRQLAKRGITVLLFCAVFFSVGFTNVKALENENNALLSFEELYFYKEGKKGPLFLAPKIVVRFYSSKTEDEQNLFLSQIQGIGYEKISLGGDAIVFSFLPTVTPETLIKAIKEVSQGGEADAAPVFILEGREVTIEGIILEPTTTVSIPFMKESLARLFGDISIQQFTARGKNWHVAFTDLFFLKKGKDPLHALSFANLLEMTKDAPWVAHAHPEFRFLKEPIIAEVDVTPTTGTIGEKRTVTLTIRVFDPDIRIEENLLVDFGIGDFLPASGSPPPASFFKILDSRKREERKGAFSTSVVFSWSFILYVPEKEWVISAQKIPYKKKGADPGHVETKPATFFLLPHTGSGAPLNDMPSAENLPLSVVESEREKYKDIGNEEPLSHWLDTLISWRGGAGSIQKEMNFYFWSVVVLLLLLGVFFIAYARLFLPKDTPAVPVVDVGEITRLCAEAGKLNWKDSYTAFARIVAGMLHNVWPALPREDLSLEVVKQSVKGGGEETSAVFTDEVWSLLMKLDASLALRYAPDFTPRETDTSILSHDIALLAALLAVGKEASAKRKEAYAGT